MFEGGISDDEFEAMAHQQHGLCAVCHRLPPAKNGTCGGLVVDHDHATGRIRGLLCHNCNRGLGLLGDSAATIASALAYLSA